MNVKTVVSAICFAGVLAGSACKGGMGDGAPDNEKIIKTGSSMEHNITISNSIGEIKKGENDLTLTLDGKDGVNSTNDTVIVNFRFPAKGDVIEIDRKATLDSRRLRFGRYRTRFNFEKAGAWEARVDYKGEIASYIVRLPIEVKE